MNNCDDKIRNIYYMLTYAFDEDKLFFNKEYSMGSEPFENIYDLFAFMLIKMVSFQIKRGLNCDYMLEVEKVATIKGKINVTKTIKDSNMKDIKVICEYDDFSSNSYLNKIVKTTMYWLIKSNKVSNKYKYNLKKIYFFFNDIDIIDYQQIRWNTLKYDRTNYSYRMIINLCYLIFHGLLINTIDGKYKFMDFITDEALSKIYERFVRNYFKKHYPQLNSNIEYIKWNVNDNIMTLLPTMKTDISLTLGQKTLIIDTKFYSKSLQSNFDRETIRSNNLYQIYTYVKNKDKDKTGNVSGMLLYAKTDEDVMHNYNYMMDGNMISIRTLDLTDTFERIKNTLNSIAENFILNN